jgi:hypothetical protein
MAIQEMNYEFEDYRKKPKYPELGPWPFWQVPEHFHFGYVLRLLLFLFILPWIFGYTLTPSGMFFTFIIFDYVTYRGFKVLYGQE